ncbi:hypothetical protein D6851_01930 [Altericroceibacterium spongiae]|uniref:SH3b domain-containing protein n=1 Tax=Altericroceibacterium spongiae TaxID=2320269 RepID=A0A420ERG5_9SPHN|nr:SH3 domain-containing protein [Altericroceibacterium spongiae]RKF23261.1 hypothetical protein D6851_01930 [Altericroceibacterium spongiae]
MSRLSRLFMSIAALSAVSGPASLAAQDREVPYWASLRADKVNMRVGPSESYRIDWVYHRKQLPIKVVRLKEGWRLVRDPDGAQGWIVARLLNPERSALVTGDGLAAMREEANGHSALRWNIEPGNVGKLGDCRAGWCYMDIGGHRGWMEEKRLWGAGAP